MTKPKHKAHLQIVIFEAEHSKLKGPFIKKSLSLVLICRIRYSIALLLRYVEYLNNAFHALLLSYFIIEYK